MAEDRMALVGSVYEALGRGDVPAAARLIGNAEWHEAEGMPYGGVYHGAAEVIENIFSRIAADVEGFSARPDEILAAGEDRVLAVGRYRGRGAGGELDAGFAHLWTVRGGEIVRFVQYADTHLYRTAIAG